MKCHSFNGVALIQSPNNGKGQEKEEVKTLQVYSKDLFKLLFDVSLFYENGEKGTIVIFQLG